MTDLTGKLVGTLLGAAAVTVLLGQIEKGEDPLVENFINYPLRGQGQTFYMDRQGNQQMIRPGSQLAQTMCNEQDEFAKKGVGNKNQASMAGSGGVSIEGKSGLMEDNTDLGENINMQFENARHNARERMRNFRGAASATNSRTGIETRLLNGNVVEGYKKKSKQDRNAAYAGRRQIPQPPPRSGESLSTAEFNTNLAAPVDLSPNGSPPAGTTNDYMGSQVMGANFQYPGGKEGLLTPGRNVTSSLPLGNMNLAAGEGGAPMNVAMADRLVYSTLKRARCAGTVDMIRGDLPIPVGGITSTPPGRPADTLEAGAFATMFGLNAAQAQQTTALIAQDQGSGYSAINAPLGSLVSELAEQKRNGTAPRGLSTSTFGSTAAAEDIIRSNEMLNGQTRAGTNHATMGVNSARGEANGMNGLFYAGASSV